MIGHPRETLLIRYLDGSLNALRRHEVADHLSRCQRCRDRVQAHRGTLHALSGIELPPPERVLSRIVAAHAAGEIVILPVVDESTRTSSRSSRSSHRPFAMGARVAAVLLAMFALTQLPFSGQALKAGAKDVRAWFRGDWIGRTWKDLFGGVPRVMTRPTAPPTAFDPHRLRELTARYELRYYDPEMGTLRFVDSSTTLRIRRDGDLWQVNYREAHPNGTGVVVVATLDARTLAFRSSSELEIWKEGRRGPSHVSWFYRLADPSTLENLRFSTRLGAPNTQSPSDTMQRYAVDPSDRTPMTPNYQGIDIVMMMASPLATRWVGRLDHITLSMELKTRRPIVVRDPESHRVRGSTTLDLPIGETPVWKVESWGVWGISPMHEFYRKEDGLLAAILTEPSVYRLPEYRLLSVTYP